MSNKTVDRRERIFHSHFPNGYSQAIQDYAINTLLIKSRYIFTKRVAGVQFGYCTHCQQRYVTDNLNHNQSTECKKCHSECTVKASGRGRKYLRDSTYFVYYEKSIASPGSIIARGIYAVRDYSGDFTKVNTIYTTDAMYLFEPGNSQMFVRGYYGPRFYERDTIISESNNYNWAIIGCSYESIAEAAEGTLFQYSTWEQYKGGDMVKFFGLFSKYPCVEYLTKMKLKYFVSAKLCNGYTYGAINWRGKNISQVLRLNKQQIKNVREFIDSGEGFSPLAFRLYQISERDGSKYSLPKLQEISIKYNYHFNDLQKILKYTTLRRALAYIRKQDKKLVKMPLSGLIIHWKDYISDCVTLEMDLSQKHILFPSNIRLAHEKTIEQIEVMGDELLNAKMAKRVDAINKRYAFEKYGIFIRAALSSDELIAEGKALRHCVGTYANNYAEGKTNILVIRRSSAPDTPFYTMEIKGGRIIQTQGYKHCTPEGDVEKFVKDFKSEKIDRETRNKQVNKSA